MAIPVLKVNPDAGDAEAIRQAARVLADGGLVAFPTETVYGLAVRGDDPAAVRRLRDVKSRSSQQPFTVHIGAPDHADRFAPGMTGLAKRLIRKGWPGPLTIVFEVESPTDTSAMQGLSGASVAVMYREKTIGLRCPDHPVAAALLHGVDAPVIAASANPAGAPAPHTADELLTHFDDRIDLCLDSGRTKYDKPSTIVRVTGDDYELLREGVYDSGIVERLASLRLLFVCTGNTCRSPMAEAMAKGIASRKYGCGVSDLPKHRISIGSAGTHGGWGAAAEHAVTAMRKRQLDISGHESSRLSDEMIRRADHVFVMTRSHYNAIRKMVPDAADRVALLLEDRDVSDPVGGDEQAYEASARVIERGVGDRLEEVGL